MIYKFKSDETTLEVEILNSNKMLLTIHQDIESIIVIDNSQLYDLIGALHSLQAKMKKEANNG